MAPGGGASWQRSAGSSRSGVRWSNSPASNSRSSPRSPGQRQQWRRSSLSPAVGPGIASALIRPRRGSLSSRSPAREAAAEVQSLTSMLHTMYRRFDVDNESDALALTTAAQLDAVCRRLKGLDASLMHFSALDTDEQVYWLEREGQIHEHVRMMSAPIDVGPLIHEWIMAQCKSLVLVSATSPSADPSATIGSSVGMLGSHPIAGRMEVKEVSISSPFDYERQAMLAIVQDLPEPTHPEYADAPARGLVHTLVSASRGRALVLFTSFALLEQVRAGVAAALPKTGSSCWRRATRPGTRLLEAFRRAESAVLFGTDSFWEGVDVPGEALSLVVLTRLPFDVPTEPVSAARAERLQEMGRSPFGEYTLPRAVLKLKQGFGRLIRSRKMTGAPSSSVTGASTRSRTERVFLDSSPRASVRWATRHHIAGQIRRFLFDAVDRGPTYPLARPHSMYGM